MSDNSLVALAMFHGTDKHGQHHYIQHYDRHFSDFRHKPVRLLEIGIGGDDNPNKGGASLRMWRDYFELGQIFGLDLFAKNIQEDRISIFTGSQADPLIISKIIQSVPDRCFDIIIDDGSHRSEHVIATFFMLFPYVANCGWYVIEDTQTSYWPKFGGSADPYSTKLTIMSFFKGLVDGLNWQEVHQPGYVPNETDLGVTEIHFYHNLIFLRKGSNEEGSNLIDNNRAPEWLIS